MKRGNTLWSWPTVFHPTGPERREQGTNRPTVLLRLTFLWLTLWSLWCDILRLKGKKKNTGRLKRPFSSLDKYISGTWTPQKLFRLKGSFYIFIEIQYYSEFWAVSLRETRFLTKPERQTDPGLYSSNWRKWHFGAKDKRLKKNLQHNISLCLFSVLRIKDLTIESQKKTNMCSVIQTPRTRTLCRAGRSMGLCCCVVVLQSHISTNSRAAARASGRVKSVFLFTQFGAFEEFLVK